MPGGCIRTEQELCSVLNGSPLVYRFGCWQDAANGRAAPGLPSAFVPGRGDPERGSNSLSCNRRRGTRASATGTS
jgi:hypothetical protein